MGMEDIKQEYVADWQIAEINDTERVGLVNGHCTMCSSGVNYEVICGRSKIPSLHPPQPDDL